jgi:uncharacterized protein YodC (DUF2158 family)
MSDFRPGYNVVLKSGGQAMTVCAVVGDKVICIRVDDAKNASTMQRKCRSPLSLQH